MVRHAGAAPAPAGWKTAVLDVTPMTRMKMVAASGIAPDSPRLQRGANLSQPFDALRLPFGGLRALSLSKRLMACGQRYLYAMSLLDEARQLAPNLSRGMSFVYILTDTSLG